MSVPKPGLLLCSPTYMQGRGGISTGTLTLTGCYTCLQYRLQTSIAQQGAYTSLTNVTTFEGPLLSSVLKQLVDIALLGLYRSSSMAALWSRRSCKVSGSCIHERPGQAIRALPYFGSYCSRPFFHVASFQAFVMVPTRGPHARTAHLRKTLLK